MSYITQEHLDFLNEANQAFDNDIGLTTYRNEELGLIALRRGVERDCIQVLNLGEEVAFFAEQLKSAPHLRKPLYQFATQMEWQLRLNDSKLGWNKLNRLDIDTKLRQKVMALSDLLTANMYDDSEELTELCADIGNYAMMLYDNEGEK
ncbi:hypothetical protein [Terribacillus sp. DMT04]|uniref:hypothetical protein n=1 Tax=Terribacillus sp. DMT04 TaxID=2850441 RepID=UPI001C2C30FD|nr:hypothetical protein [Terribacillus sp. DMT04]QXE02798.1 hypothetical protein KS242_06355 [Terribacillus sp. DMT04]